MGVYQTDIFIRIAPDAEYEDGETKADLIEAMQAALYRNAPGNSYSFTQPIVLRVQALVAGVRSDIGLSLYGDDLDQLKIKGDEIVRALSFVAVSADVAAADIRLAVYDFQLCEACDVDLPKRTNRRHRRHARPMRPRPSSFHL